MPCDRKRAPHWRSGGGRGRQGALVHERSHVPTDETPGLIASDKVEDTSVYNPAGEKLGTIAHFMVGKQSGPVEYAVLRFGGFLGLGADHYPLPWDGRSSASKPRPRTRPPRKASPTFVPGDRASLATGRDLYVGARIGFAASDNVLLFAKGG
jgi:hypothetical protein